MSHQARQRAALQASHANNDLYAKVEREINAGYLEVEITGISLRRFVAAYRVLARGAWAYALGSVRSLVRPTPAL